MLQVFYSVEPNSKAAFSTTLTSPRQNYEELYWRASTQKPH